MAYETIPLPPPPPPLGSNFDQVLWNAHWSYADLLIRRERYIADEAERVAAQKRHQDCLDGKTAISDGVQMLVVPALNRIADAWDAADAAISRLAEAMGSPPPPPPPPPIFRL